MKRSSNTVNMSTGVGSSSGVSKAADSSSNVKQFNRTSGLKCFGCEEARHRKSECKKTAEKKHCS